nr:hypothetical protein [Liquorilactobacillus uvarum]
MKQQEKRVIRPIKYSTEERGSNENVNRMLREYFPKKKHTLNTLQMMI